MNGTRILVIDDETAIRRFLRISFEAEGCMFLEASSGQEGLVLASSSRPEVIILDLGLPDMDGLTVLKRLREWTEVPVIVLTVKDAEIDKVMLLDSGANDYLTKPFSVPELLARVRNALRHKQPSVEQTIFHSGPLEIDFVAHLVRVNGEPVRLTALEYDLLRHLAQHAGKMVTQRQLLKEVWGPHAVEHTHYLRIYVRQLRKKIERDPSRPELIQTEPGVGYRLVVMT